jgi:ubiquinone/menaquinone biosynthesis C-methylase UbiE
MDNQIITTQEWYEKSYKKAGFKAQRLYPNEELLRFMGRNFFSTPYNERQGIKILEPGCGSCSNLWMIAKENFDAYGIDLSAASIELGELMLEKWGVKAKLSVGSMTQLPYEENYFDAVVDVFSSNCLNVADFELFLNQLHKVVKPGGKVFSYTPSAASEAFINYQPAEKIDPYTINGIYRESSPYYGNFYTLRFETKEHITALYKQYGFEITGMELITRTYNNMGEPFQHISLEAIKK